MFTSSPQSQESVILLTGLHSSHDPYCTDKECWCHSSDQWHSQVTAMPQHNEETIRSAFSIFGLIRQ